MSFDDTLNEITRVRDADAYYRSHHEIDTIIGHYLGGAAALSLEKQYKQEGDNPYGIIQYKTFGSPVVSGNLGSRVGKFCKSIVMNSILDLGVAGGLTIGSFADSAIGFADGGVLIGLGADIGKQIANDMGTRLTEDNNTSPDRVRCFGDPISAFDCQAQTVMPSFKQRGKSQHIHILVYLCRMQCLSMILKRTHYSRPQMIRMPK